MNIYFKVIFILGTVLSVGAQFQWYSTDPDIFRNTTQVLTSRGFQSEIHHPITKDGYILTLVRIVNSYITNQSNLKPIYIQHGLFGNADDFVVTHRGLLVNGTFVELPNLTLTNCTGLDTDRVAQSLALVLATCGYDVWLGNFRGNRYSNRHILLDPHKDSEYWAYSVDELSKFDVPANIEYILSTTGNVELGYIGHSLGTSVMFQLLSEQPSYSAYIKPFISLAPVAYVDKIEAALLVVAAHIPAVNAYLSSRDWPLFGIPSDMLAVVDQSIATFICGNTFLQPLCTLFLFSLCGYDFSNTDTALVVNIYGHFPDGSSTRLLSHMSQRVNRATFDFYDFGTLENIRSYGMPTVPSYNLSQINSPYIILVSGLNDYLADPKDVDRIRSQLTVRPYKDYVIPYAAFNHVDFLIGNNVGKFQNAMVLRWLDEIYNN